MNTDLNQEDWDPLLELLREEVQEYGGLYNLLERQQREVFERAPESVMSTNEEVEHYMGQMGLLRERREEQVVLMANRFGCDTDLSLSNMLDYFPEFIRPLLKALIDEINEMVRRTRRKARQNFLLLSRTMELTQEAISSLQPDNYTKTYSRKGKVGMTGKMPTRYKAFV
ncbi:flagellar protein FlgN [Puniceicoccaceae bacterium K14]|nr:flagellar protein FlgN [Puniceicoccaceae bacterium K14]